MEEKTVLHNIVSLFINSCRLVVSPVLFILLFSIQAGGGEPDVKTGDIIFHESWSDQGKAIKYMAGSKYSHAGIVIVYNNKVLVLEAAARIKISKLQTFIMRGTGRHFVVKRLKDYKKLINPQSLNRLKRMAKKLIGKIHDYAYQWDDRGMYSAELVWKIFYRGLGVRLCGFRKLGSLDLSHPFIKMHMDDTFGESVPLDEPVVLPEMIFYSDKLYTVYEQ